MYLVLLSLLLSACVPDAPPAPEPAPVVRPGLPNRSSHGTVLYAGEGLLIVQHDNTLGRVVVGVGTYAVGDVDVSGLTPGQHVDLRVEERDGRTQLKQVAVTGTDPLPDEFRADGWPVRGTVIRPDRGQVMIDHEPVEGLMPAMVMPFRVHSSVARTLHSGDRITARILVTAYGYHLVQVKKVGVDDGGLRVDIPPVDIGAVFPRTRVTAEDGTELVLGQGQGIPTALSFIFTTCPDPNACPATVARLQALQPALGGKARILAVTIDPDTDSVEVLKAYAEVAGADPAIWRMGRVDPLALDEVALRAGLGVTKRDGRITHALRLLVLDEQGVLLERYDDNRWPLARVVTQLTTGGPRADALGTLIER